MRYRIEYFHKTKGWWSEIKLTDEDLTYRSPEEWAKICWPEDCYYHIYKGKKLVGGSYGKIKRA